MGLYIYDFCSLRFRLRPSSQVSENTASSDPCACRRFAQCRGLQHLGSLFPSFLPLEPKPLRVHFTSTSFQFAAVKLEKLTADGEPNATALPASRSWGRKLNAAEAWLNVPPHSGRARNIAPSCQFVRLPVWAVAPSYHNTTTTQHRYNIYSGTRVSGTNVPTAGCSFSPCTYAQHNHTGAGLSIRVGCSTDEKL